MRDQTQEKALNLRLRYTRELADPDLPCREEHFAYGHVEWSLPIAQTAVILVDCWATHPVVSFVERADQIIREKIHPVVQAARAVDLPIVHAPAPQWARNYPQSALYYEEPSAAQDDDHDWPPRAFRFFEGEYELFGAHKLWHEPAQNKFWEDNPKHQLRVHELLEPTADDFVIIDSDQLQHLCREKGILHLIYAGFATNICVQHRHYGMRPMAARGYNTMLIRDATMGIETADTLADLSLTAGAIRNIEMKVGPSVTADQMVDALAELRN